MKNKYTTLVIRSKREQRDAEKLGSFNSLGYKKIVIVRKLDSNNWLVELDGRMSTVVNDDLMSSIEHYRLKG